VFHGRIGSQSTADFWNPDLETQGQSPPAHKSKFGSMFGFKRLLKIRIELALAYPRAYPGEKDMC